MAIEIKMSGTVAYIHGGLDDRVDYSSLLQLPAPLQLNLAGVKSMNSHGIRSWIKFLADWGSKPLELYECPSVFLDAVNLVPQIASPSGSAHTIKSVSVPYHCLCCNRIESYELAIADVKIKGERVTVPGKQCRTCGTTLGPEIDPEDLFLFLTEPA